MKTITAFNQVVPDLIDAGLQPILSRVITHDLQPLLVAATVVGEDTDLVNAPGVSIQFPRDHDTESLDFAELDDIPNPQHATPALVTPEIEWEFVEVTPFDFGLGDTITNQNKRAAFFNAITTLKDNLVRSHAKKSDQEIWEGLVNAKTVLAEALSSGGGGNTETLADDHILEIIQVVDDPSGTPAVLVLGTDFTVDYFRGKIKFVPATTTPEVDYIFSDNDGPSNPNTDYAQLNYSEVITVNDFVYEDVVNAEFDISDVNGDPDVIILENLAARLLTLSDQFIKASAHADEIVQRGLMGHLIGGMKVLKTQQMWRGVAITMKMGASTAVKVWKEKVRTRMEKVQKKPDDDFLMLWEASAVGVKHADQLAVSLNAQPGSEALP